MTGHTLTKCRQRKVRGYVRENPLPDIQGDLGVGAKSAPICRM